MQVSLQAQGRRFLVMLFPVFIQLDDYPFKQIHEMLADRFKRHSITFIDLLSQFKDKQDDELWIFPYDQHPNEIVHRQVADTLAGHLKTEADSMRRLAR